MSTALKGARYSKKSRTFKKETFKKKINKSFQKKVGSVDMEQHQKALLF